MANIHIVHAKSKLKLIEWNVFSFFLFSFFPLFFQHRMFEFEWYIVPIDPSVFNTIQISIYTWTFFGAMFWLQLVGLPMRIVCARLARCWIPKWLALIYFCIDKKRFRSFHQTASVVALCPIQTFASSQIKKSSSSIDEYWINATVKFEFVNRCAWTHISGIPFHFSDRFHYALLSSRYKINHMVLCCISADYHWSVSYRMHTTPIS